MQNSSRLDLTYKELKLEILDARAEEFIKV